MDPITAMLGMSMIQGIFGGLSSALSGAEARKQRKFAAREAEKQRNWMEEMSNTSHQREVVDLRAAGLNPILSAGGSGASVSGGASASAPPVPDTSQKILDSGIAIGNAIMSAVSLQKDVKLANSQLALNELQGDSVKAEIAYKNQLTRRQNMENNLYPKVAAEKLLGMIQNRHESGQRVQREIERIALQKFDVESKYSHLRRGQNLEMDRHDDNLKEKQLDRALQSRIAEANFSTITRGQDMNFASDLMKGLMSLFPNSTPK